MSRSLVAVRAAVYVTGMVFLWGWIALSVRRFDARLGGPLPPWAPAVGTAALALGAALGLWCVVEFVARGRGTPAPFDPPRKFVAAGPYRFVRNPMYVGGLAALAGLGLVNRSPAILVLAATVFLLVHLFVVWVEEPGLEARFGESYRAYKRAVRRWLPRWPR